MAAPSSTNPWAAQVLDFDSTRQDSTPWVFVKKTPAGVAIPNTGNTYKMEAHSEQEPASETGQLWSLVGTAGGASGTITFNPTGGTGGDTDPAFEEIYYDVVETAAGKERTIFKGRISFGPRITDKGV